MKSHHLLIVIPALLCSCADFNKAARQLGGAGVLTDRSSPFDGAREINMQPAPVGAVESTFDTCCMIGLLWKSTTPDQAVMTVSVEGIQQVSGTSLRIDDRIINLIPVDAITGFTEQTDPVNPGRSLKRYLVKRSDLDTMTHSRKALIRIDGARSYRVGDLVKDDGGLFWTFFHDWHDHLP